MAALELHCGPEPGSCVWGGDRVDLLDSFDSEMQEWEDQLQDMQRKIEELYNEVKARREASESSPNNNTNKNLDITLLPVSSQYSHQANGYHEPRGHPNNSLPTRQCSEIREDPSVMQRFGFHHPSEYCHGPNNYMLSSLSNGSHYPASCHDLERQDATLDILNGYLQQSPHFRRNTGNFRVSNRIQNPKVPVTTYQDSTKTSLVKNRTASCVVLEEIEVENKKNKKSNWDDSQARHVSWKDPVSSNDLPPKNSASKLATRQRDASPVIPRSTYHESSQQPDRKCLLLDRKSGSPSVLRKFGAMLQENEGKTLIEDGLVTTVVSTEPLRNNSTPICQSKFDARRASSRVPVQKCIADCDALVADLEPSQESWAAGASRYLLNGDKDSGNGGCVLEQHGLACNLSQTQSHLNSGYHKVASLSKSQKAGSQSEDLFSDYQMVERILGARSQNFSTVHRGLGVDMMRLGNDNLEQLLEMMELENSRSQRVTFTQQLDNKQVNRESSPAHSSSHFSRPARPANQRRPSRWARHTHENTIAHTSCPPSPGLKAKQFLNSYSRHTETVIM
ncbi:uncharacterized protein LOC122332799 [Puntigrus tetrazona]|uniref:uncharacterized protein LOC122332799 n=1 Tax=Puntigrus tetrazona TaxID=1606681 RepID=UPI001C897CD4|nr:uncharacterized protein LOC122332799 [Puntigrus tetrazona]XP_043086140.1 uncharacterized protein LOC122332799 [Puntigrus tetrazona]XP_043086141.1 uncharacterized protein LOC122332799 [Puntigrus tetrazona]